MVQGTQNESETKASAEPSGLATVLDRTFGLTAAGTSVPTELRAGLATFLTMAYIMFVNPAILEKAGTDHGAVYVATCVAAALDRHHGGLRQLSDRTCPRHGAQCLFRLHQVPELGGNWQLAMASCSSPAPCSC
jgi:adenine/guanine/hypoxanthine permease